MKLSAEARTMIDFAVQQGFDRQHFQSPQRTREQLKTVLSVPVPTPVGAVTNASAGEGVPVRLYTPEGAGPFPVVAYFHGGGFTLMGLDTHDEICRKLCRQSGCAVLSVAYRLAPEHPFPAGPQSGVDAVLWLIDEAERLGIDAGRLATAGDSSGGYMALWVARALSRRGLPVRAQFAAYPVTDHYTSHHPSWDEFRTGYVLSAEMAQWFWDQYLPNPDQADAASLLRSDDFSGLPPAFIVNGNFDPLRDEGVAYAAKLRAAGGEARHELVNSVHGFLGIGETGERVLSEAALFLKEKLGA